MIRHWFQKHKPPLVALLALTLALRVLVPAGFMPALDGARMITLCTGMGAQTAWIDRDGALHRQKPVPPGGHDQPCAFLALASGAVTPPASVAPMPSFTVERPLLGSHAPSIAPGRGLAAPPPPATGPPTLV